MHRDRTKQVKISITKNAHVLVRTKEKKGKKVDDEPGRCLMKFCGARPAASSPAYTHSILDPRFSRGSGSYLYINVSRQYPLNAACQSRGAKESWKEREASCAVCGSSASPV